MEGHIPAFYGKKCEQCGTMDFLEGLVYYFGTLLCLNCGDEKEIPQQSITKEERWPGAS